MAGGNKINPDITTVYYLWRRENPAQNIERGSARSGLHPRNDAHYAITREPRSFENYKELRMIRKDVQLEFLNPKDLIPYANNARVHPESQIRRLMSSLREYGVVIPILIGDDNVIIAGHGVTEAALRIGLEAVPCVRASHLTEAQRRAFVLAANRLAEDSSWNKEVLKLEMLRLRDDYGVDLDKTGFTQREIVRLRLDMGFGNVDEDAVPDVDGPPVSRLGDVWELGDHRLMCGDSSDARVVERLLCGARPHLMVTDPPYGVNYEPEWRKRVRCSEGSREGKVLNDDVADWRDVWMLFPGDVAYIWHSARHGETVAQSIRTVGFNIRSQIVWTKPNLVLSRGDYHWKHECCLYALREDGGECPDMPGDCEGYAACW